MRGVDENACVLRSDDGVNNGCEIVDIGQGLDTEYDVIERTFSGVGGIFWISNNCDSSSSVYYSCSSSHGRRTTSGLESFVAERWGS